MIAVAATLSTQLMKKLQSLVPVSDLVSGEVMCVSVTLLLLQSVKIVTTKSLHRILPHVEQRFYKVTQTEKAGEHYYT